MERKDLLSLNFYNKSKCFLGSDRGLRYRVEKFIETAKDESQETNKKDPSLKVTLWPEPFNFDATPDDKKQSAYFPFSEEGLLDIANYINSHITP